MTARTIRDPSPFKSGLLHGALGFATLIATFGLGGGAIHFAGSADAASPTLRMALFDNESAPAPGLNPRLPSDDDYSVMASTEPQQNATSGPEPDLGVDYAGAARVPAVAQTTGRGGIRINGETVLPGQSLSQVRGVQPPAQPVAAMAAAPETAPPAPRNTFERFSRSFSNPENKPTISVIVSGLGINSRRTQAVISELPPEVTLSFAPSTRGLSTWIRRARAAGHEVLIELPMEPYDYGREVPHAQIMQIAAGDETNRKRLTNFLSQVSGYTGVMNYQGAKFATSAEAADPVFATLSAKGVAFFEDGSLPRSVFSDVAVKHGTIFGKSDTWIDSRLEADEITTQLMLLEAQALEQGASLGMGMSYPVTVDMLKEWTVQLESKGIILAPASHYAKRKMPAGQVKTAALDPQG